MSLGPLTTTFTPPADCVASSALYWVNTASTFYWLHGRPGQSSCFPDDYSPYQNQYYSPGVCPSGYTRACESISTQDDTIVATRATCCPQGNYECAATSSSYSYPWGPTLGCMSVYRVNTQTTFTTIDGTINGDEEAGSVISLFAPGTIMAYGVVIQNSPATTTAEETTTVPVSSSLSDKSAPASETSPSISTTAEAQPDSDGGVKLSAGAAAGIGIGAAFVVLALGAAVLWMFWSRRRKRRQEAAELQAQPSTIGPSNWSSTTWGAPPYTQPYTQPPVMQPNWPPPSEMPNQHGYKEMSAESRIPIEADGREVYREVYHQR
ncbi:hypothetical protein F5Y00DRAFT_207366 [Daldinia vernicosa]|uniref:uncharacterized protein n=1 Tax=Daldinia vernicosa TaxID=114800 RepID=UPI00200754E9|nr:uncharacterized protein F5Y00DRAFT_207366 [Daldinia vernicosa]KAI0852114.1 hypothetical protein F5Y00DRAFT_207366 [Daldinia vernicosa]